MKKTFACLCLCTLLWSGCKKESKPEINSVNTFNAIKDGQPWNTSGGVLLFEDEFVVSASKRVNQLDEAVTIFFKKSDINETGEVKRFSANFTYLLGGDQGIAQYKASTERSYIKSMKIDTLKKTIEGEFSIVFSKTSTASLEFKNEIIFDLGKFKIWYHKEK